MKLPSMKYLDEITKKTQVQFGGLNHSRGAGDGELWDMQNLTGDHFPLLATRAPRRLYKTMDAPGDVFSWEGLCWVDGTGFYYNGECKGEVSEGQKNMASIGAYVVIFPDKAYYNVDTGEFGNLEASWESIEFLFSDGEMDGIAYDANCLYSWGAQWANSFRPGDAVTISGCTKIPDNNKTVVVIQIDGDYMYFDENAFTLPEGAIEYEEQGVLSVTRSIPEIKYLCENENRLWGCAGDQIFSSKQGDPFNWMNRQGLESDGWDWSTGSAGDFTGCISYQGYPTFFKEDHIYKVYGSLPSDFQVLDSTVPGVIMGSGKSLAVANSILFYLSHNGVMAYTGGIPQCMGGAFGLQRFKNAVGGSDGMKYYISMQDSAGQWGLYVYDTQNGLWFREDAVQAAGFAWHAGNLYMLTAGGDLLITGNIKDIPEGTEPETDIDWFAEFADFTEEDPNRKGISKLQLRLELEEGASVQVWMMYDSDGQWHKVKEMTGEGRKRSYYLPVTPRRADHYRLKLSGTGECRIYSLVRETYSGSEH